MSADAVLLSVIVPTCNESVRIATCLRSLLALRERGAQIIVCDGGSSDDTAQIAHQHGAQVLHCARGRARQMNAGAGTAQGRMLAFLHADTHPSEAALKCLWRLACEPSPHWGRFDVRLSGDGLAFRVIETCMNARSRFTGIATGDQLIFCSSDLFRQVGAFADIELMEDIQLSTKLRHLQPPVACTEHVRTSSRKWREDGVARTVLLMWSLRLAYAMGVAPARLAKLYYRREPQ